MFTAKEAAKMEPKKRQVYAAFSPSFHSEHLHADEILKKHNIQIIVNNNKLDLVPLTY